MLSPLQVVSAVASITIRSHPTPRTEDWNASPSPSSIARASIARRSGSAQICATSSTGAHSGSSDHRTEAHAS